MTILYIGKTNLICISHTQTPNTTYVDDGDLAFKVGVLTFNTIFFCIFNP